MEDTRRTVPVNKRNKVCLTHRDWSSKQRLCTGLHQVLCVFVMTQFRFMGFPNVGTGGSDSCTFPGLLCWVALSNFEVMVFVLSYYILFLYVLLLSLRSLFFLMKDRDGVDSNGRGKGGTLWSGGRGSCN